MRAHKPMAKGKADAVSRARMPMKSRLWWLDGFPGDDGWTALPLDGLREVETLALDGTHLRRVTLTVNELRRDFPRALGRIVGDGERWAEATHRVVSLVKPWVHGGGRPPASLFDTDSFPRAVREQAGGLAAGCSALAPSIGALSWLLATRGKAASGHVRFLARNRDALACIAEPGGGRSARDRIVLVLRLAQLGVTAGESFVAPLVAVAADRRIDTAPLRDARDAAGRASAAIRPAALMVDCLPGDPIEPALPGEVASWVAFLCSVHPTVQRRFLRLLAACDLPDLIAAWSVWWADHAKLIARLERSTTAAIGLPRPTSSRACAARSCSRCAVGRPPLHERKLGRALRSLSADACEPCAAPARAVLARLPAQPGLRAAFLVQWAGRVANGAAVKRLVTWLTALRDYLAATGATEQALAPLAADARTEAERNRTAYCLLDELDSRPPDHMKRFFAALAALHARRPEAMSREMASRVDELADHVREPDCIAALAAALHEAGHANSWLSDEVTRGALALSGDDPAVFAAMASAIRELHGAEPYANPEVLVGSLAPAFVDDPLLLRELLAAGDRRILLACGGRLSALLAVGEALPVLAEQTDATAWIDEQPPRLHRALRLLARSTPEAEAIARRAIGAVWRSSDALEQERAAIARRLERAAGDKRAVLEARLSSLARKILEPSTPPERVQRKLEEKLRRRAALERLQALDNAARARLAPAAARHFGLYRRGGLARRAEVAYPVARVRRAAGADRSLARQILRVRSGPPPWDLRDHPANQSFLRRLESRGIDPGAWVDGIGTVERKSKSGPLRLSLEDDPLEVLHMGAHFRTCLGPAPTTSSRPRQRRRHQQARAVRADGGRRGGGAAPVLPHRRRGDARLSRLLPRDVDRLRHDVGELARDLAARMRTRVAGRGQVPCLVASRWYDDGPETSPASWPSWPRARRSDSGCRTPPPPSCPRCWRPSWAGPRLTRCWRRSSPGCPSCPTRPELVHALLPLIRDRAHLAADAVLRLVALLESAGDAATAAELFGEALERSAVLAFRTQGWVGMDIIEPLCRIDPGRALRAMRRTRPDGARSWRDEKHADCLVAAAGALERLRRPAQAAALLRQAAAASGPGEAVAAARRRLDELAA